MGYLSNDPPAHPDAAKRSKSYKKEQRQTRKEEGLCPGCGDEPKDGISSKTGKPYISCQACLDESYESVKENKERTNYKDPARVCTSPRATMTKQRYRVVRTNEVGVVVPCPCPDPLILEFKESTRDAYHAHQIN